MARRKSTKTESDSIPVSRPKAKKPAKEVKYVSQFKRLLIYCGSCDVAEALVYDDAGTMKNIGDCAKFMMSHEGCNADKITVIFK